MLATQTISLANRCNLACTYCWYETDAAAYPSRQLSAVNYAAWFEACAKVLTLENVYLTGGEPTLHAEFEDILCVAAAHFERAVLLTNGVSLGQRRDLLDAIKRFSVEVHVSLDHVSSGIDDRVRGGTRAVLRGIYSLAEAGVPTQVTMVLTARNATDLDPAIALCRENHLALEVNIVSLPSQHPLSVLSLSRDQREAAARAIREAEDLLGRTDYYAQVRSYLRTGRIMRLHHCRAATEGIFIQSDGEIVVCGQRLHDRLGSILYGNPADILRNQEGALAVAPGGPCVSLDCLTVA